MKNKITNKLFFISLIAVSLNILTLPQIVNGQVGSSIDITKYPFLYFDTIPTGYKFNTVKTSTEIQHLFEDTGYANLDQNRIVTVTDHRNSGGFLLQVTSTDLQEKINNTLTIPKKNLKVVTSKLITPKNTFTLAPSDSNDQVVYLLDSINTPFPVSKHKAVAPLNVTIGPSETCNYFNNLETFTNTNCRTNGTTSSNQLSGTVDLIQSCIPSGDTGISGSMAIGTTYNLDVPPYTVPGTYQGIVTYTLTNYDSTCS